MLLFLQSAGVKKFFWTIVGSTFFLFFFFSEQIVLAGTTPPITSHTLSGVPGYNGWYKDDIDVLLTVVDDQSGPKSTTYWIDAGVPTVVDHLTQTVQSFNNNSFEDGNFFEIQDWYNGFDGAGAPLAIYYRSTGNSYDGNRSAAVAFISFSGDFHYWHNENKAKLFTEGEEIEISAWAKTAMFSDDYALFEVWAQRADGSGDERIGSSNHLVDFNWSWREATATVTVPFGKPYIYIKAGAVGTPAAITYWDYVSVTPANSTQAQVSFTHTTEGQHTLHYFSDDLNGNIEPEATAALKIDRFSPTPWDGFTSSKNGCDHCFTASVAIQDGTSGVDVLTAEYRFYTDHLNQLWSSWLPVDSVKLSGSNVNATSGTTSPVTLSADDLDFGDSSTGLWRVQYRITDVAGNQSTSPVYEIATPWIKAWNGSVYAAGEIVIGTPANGEDHSNADVMSGDLVTNFLTEPDWIEEHYSHQLEGVTDLTSYIPSYEYVRQHALPLPNGDLPMIDGVFLHNGDYAIANSTLPHGYDDVAVSAVVIIEGDLFIDTSFSVDPENATMFIVEGDILVKNTVEECAGFFLASGTFNSDRNGNSTKPLLVDGSMVALTGYELARDLGDSGAVNNLNTPAERFNWRSVFVRDADLARLLSGQNHEYVWQETSGSD